jgi:hypothetical protein
MIVKDAATTALGALNASVAAGCEDAEFVGVQVSGTFSGTLTFQATIDGTNWVTMAVQPLGATAATTWVTTATAAGVWTRPVGGLKQVRVQMTAYTSGSASVTIVETRAVK